jgi:hypothetical protein
MRKGYPCHLIVSVLVVGLLVALSGGAMAAEVPRIQGELTIFSAASLTDAFKEMAAQIEQANCQASSLESATWGGRCWHCLLHRCDPSYSVDGAGDPDCAGV